MQPQGFGARVKGLRQEKGWPQPRLADAVRALGVPVAEGEISRIETGAIKNPGLAKLAGLAKALGTSTDYLLGITKSPAPCPPGSPEAQVKKARVRAKRAARAADEPGA